jgi:hypothetical protein
VSNSVSVLSQNDTKLDLVVDRKSRARLGDNCLAQRCLTAIFCLTCKRSLVRVQVRPPNSSTGSAFQRSSCSDAGTAGSSICSKCMTLPSRELHVTHAESARSLLCICTGKKRGERETKIPIPRWLGGFTSLGSVVRPTNDGYLWVCNRRFCTATICRLIAWSSATRRGGYADGAPPSAQNQRS